MSKKQGDYLSALLSGGTAPATSPVPGASPVATPRPEEPPKRAMTLLARESALARVATGEVKQVTQLLLDPARVRIWTGNARHQASLNEESCRDLIEAILAEGGQKVPAIVRRLPNDQDFDYEVIAGSRRHWAISWLRANSYPDMMFLAQVHNLDDEAAFRISDIENRARKDVSDFERARTYLQALGEHYGGKQVRMAERLHLSKGWLSKMITVANLPDWAVDAFASPADIQLKACYPLAQRLQAGSAPAHMRAAAKALKAEQARRAADGLPPIAAAEVLQRLTTPPTGATSEADLISLPAQSGRTALSVLSSNRNGVTVRLHAASGASDEELARMLKDALDALRQRGQGLNV